MDPVLCKLLSLLYINTSASTDFNHLTSFSCKSGVPATNSLPGQTCLQGDEASAGADKMFVSIWKLITEDGVYFATLEVIRLVIPTNVLC